MKYKDEVKSLRDKLAPNVATITVLLVTQTIETLSNADLDQAQSLNYKLSFQHSALSDIQQKTSRSAVTQLRLEANQSSLFNTITAQGQNLCTLTSKANELLENSVAFKSDLDHQAAVLEDIQKNGNTIRSRIQESKILTASVREDTAKIKAAIPSILGRVLGLMRIVTAGFSKLQDITSLISQLIQLTTQFTI